MAASCSSRCSSNTKQQQHGNHEQHARTATVRVASFSRFPIAGPAAIFPACCCCALDCARGALRSSGLGRSTCTPRRPYTVPPPRPPRPPPPPLLLLLLSQCRGIEMIHVVYQLPCCRTRSSSRAVRAGERVVISDRRIIHDTKWEQSVA